MEGWSGPSTDCRSATRVYCSHSMKKSIQLIVRFLSSYALACIILVLLTLLTYLGTIEQARLGLYLTKQKYFESFFLIHYLPGGLPLPLPGVYLLLIIFSINLILGGLLRLKRRPSHIGLFIIHGGILYLLVAGLVTHEFAYDGQMTLAEGQTSNRFQSYHDWEIALVDVTDPDDPVEYLIPEDQFEHLRGDQSRVFQHPELPFDARLSGFAENAQVVPKGPMFDAPMPVVDGFFVNPIRPEKDNEFNMAAVYVTLLDKEGDGERREILWARSLLPLTLEAGDRTWALWLRRQTWSLPFSIQLTDFQHEYYPGTRRPRNYQSDVVKIENGAEQPVKIRMNEPLRHAGFTFFQASFREEPERGEVYSTFAVVRNPADHWPLYSLYVITAGLIIHFGQRLLRYLKTERESRA